MTVLAEDDIMLLVYEALDDGDKAFCKVRRATGRHVYLKEELAD